MKSYNEEEYLGHVDYKTQRKEPLKVHFNDVAKFSLDICPLPELNGIVELIGCLHDAGKLGTKNQEDFRAILEYGDKAHSNNLDHSTAGGRIAMEYGGGIGQLVSLIVYFHHGMQNCIEGNGTTLHERRELKDIEYDLIKERFFQIYDEDLIKRKFELANIEFKDIRRRIEAFCSQDKKYGSRDFYLGMYLRLLLSILIDSDWTSTSCFFDDSPLPVRFSLEETQKIWKQSIDYFESYLNTEIKNKFKVGNLLNKYRQEISDLCKEKATEKTNLYRLTVPTGAGKTLSSLRFALHHALEYNKEHIIYIAPFNSILEQNAEEVRKAIGDSKIVLEHHCNVIHEDEEKETEYNKLVETWDSPIIVTTAVQILNTLFSDSKNCIRRMHTLCNSIIIFDEVQAFPLECVELFNLAVNFLSNFCNTTVVLCSATQPTIAQTNENCISECKEMIDEFEKYANIFKRTRIEDITEQYPGGMNIDTLKDFTLSKAKDCKSVLVILNTTTCAKKLFQALENDCSDRGYHLFHLSNNMCAKNKMDKLKEIKEALKNNEKVICVSTQLVEAGIDFSFECVIRSMAGLDSIIQAAGRCNRYKEFGKLGIVYIIKMSEKVENLNNLSQIRRCQDAMQKLLDDFNYNPEDFDNTLDSKKAILTYYENYFGDYRIKNQTKFLVNVEGRTENLVDLLGKCNSLRAQYKKSHKKDKVHFAQAFKTAGEKFEVISDDYKVNVIVPYDDVAKSIIEKLEGNDLKLQELKKALRLLQVYTVAISENKKNELSNAIRRIHDGEFFVISEEYYSSELGVLDTPSMKFLMF